MSILKTLEFKTHGDNRGSLSAFELIQDIPFEVKRIYCLYNTITGSSRGFHAHKSLKQVIVCITGNCRFVIDDGSKRESILLNVPTTGILVEGCVWREIHDFSKDCVLLVFASEVFKESDYIRDYKTFKETVEQLNYDF